MLNSFCCIIESKDSITYAVRKEQLLVTNIPTVVFLFIYLGVREQRKNNILVDKMKIQDL